MCIVCTFFCCYGMFVQIFGVTFLVIKYVCRPWCYADCVLVFMASLIDVSSYEMFVESIVVKRTVMVCLSRSLLRFLW